MTNDKQHAANYFATAPKGMLNTMQGIIRKHIDKSTIGIFASMDGYTDADKDKLSAYWVVAAGMGITIGQWVLNRETGIARATIVSGTIHA